ncbi:MAG TPA: CD225/dispanin family protein [Thermoanaerobaculia bacterium]
MWYYAQAGQQQGPISDEQIKRMVQDGSLGKEDLVWREGMASWQPAGEVPGLEFAAPTFTPAPLYPPPAAPAAPIITPPPPPPDAVAPYAAPQYQGMPTPPAPSYGAPQPAAWQAGSDIPDLLVWSILVTVFCCLPGGIISIIFASKANSAKRMGDFEAARLAAKQAKTWLTVSVVAGLLLGLLGIFSSVIIPILQQRH